jgi:hypothetical protein
MKIIAKEIYALRRLKVGDKVNIENFKKINPFTLLEMGLRDKYGSDYPTDMLKNDFEKIGNGIWEEDEIEREDGYYLITIEGTIVRNYFEFYKFEKDYFKNKCVLLFKKLECAKEYREKLIEFNEKYKKKMMK